VIAGTDEARRVLAAALGRLGKPAWEMGSIP